MENHRYYFYALTDIVLLGIAIISSVTSCERPNRIDSTRLPGQAPKGHASAVYYMSELPHGELDHPFLSMLFSYELLL